MSGIRRPAPPQAPAPPRAAGPPVPPTPAPYPPIDRPAGPETPRAPEVRPVRTGRDRAWALDPDPSGMYQQDITIDVDTEVRPFTLQVHRAGRTVVGWFAPPPGTFGKSAELTSWPPLLERGVKKGPGVFIADARRARPDGFVDMYWWRTTTAAAAGNPGDPTDPEGRRPDNESAGHGSIRFETGADRITVRFATTGSADVFTRYSPRLRPPWSAVRHLTGTAAAAALLHHVAPLGPRWLSTMLEHLAGPETIDHLTEWHVATTSTDLPPIIVLEVRRALVKHVGEARDVKPGKLPDAYRVSVQNLVRARLGAVPVTIQGVTRSLWQWLEQVAAEIPAGEVEPVWQNLGIETAGETGFAYIVDIETLSPSRLIELAGMRAPKVMPGLKVTLTALLLSVRRVPVRFVLDGSKARVRDADGTLVVADPAALERAQSEGEYDLVAPTSPRFSTRLDGPGTYIVGVFADIGVGLGFDLTAKRRSQGGFAPDMTSKPGAAVKLGQVTFFSSARVEAKDFDGATYSVVSFGGPGSGLGPVTGPSTVSSSLHILRLTGGARLERVVTVPATLGSASMPKPRKLQTLDAIRNFLAPVVKLTLFELSMGFGGTMVFGPGAPSRPEERTPTFDHNFLARDSIPHLQWFDRGRWTLRESSNPFRDDRALLEVYLATARGLISPGMSINVDGHTSPEGKPEINLRLSSDRAREVADAIEDALPEMPDVLDVGHGESQARAAGLLDPPEALAAQLEWEREHRDQVFQWPPYRKVEIVINGETLVEGLWEP